MPDAPLPAPDGSPEAPIPVGGIDEEYAWLAANRPGARVTRQALLFRDGRPLDALDLALPDGTSETLHFDVSGFLAGF